MKRNVLIEKNGEHVWTFFLENDDIVEIHCASADEKKTAHQIGDIYIGKVKNIVQNIGAAFIEIEPGVNCYFDLACLPRFQRRTGMNTNPVCRNFRMISLV